jgi:hypothetical protein
LIIVAPLAMVNLSPALAMRSRSFDEQDEKSGE